MLVLSRRVGERIMIGENIVIEVMEVKGEQVRLGINAPRDVVIHREEIYEDIKRENKAAGALNKDMMEQIKQMGKR